MESKDNKKLVDSQAEEVDTSVGTAADVDEVMKKYDRESNTRIWEGTPKTIVKAIMVLFSVYCIYVTLFVGGLLEIRLTRFLAFILVIGYLNFPIKKGITKVNYLPWYDWIIMILGAGSFLYFSFRAREIAAGFRDAGGYRRGADKILEAAARGRGACAEHTPML